MTSPLVTPFAWHHYFYLHIARALAFSVPKGMRVLFIGDHFHGALHFLAPSRCVIVATSPERVEPAFRDAAEFAVEYHYGPFAAYQPTECFDYVICFSSLGETDDLNQLLTRLQAAMAPLTRLIIYQHNHLWMPLLKLGGALGLKRRETYQNWLSVSDIASYLAALGFEVVQVSRKTLLPARLLFLGPLVNRIADIVPLFDFFKINQFITARSLNAVEKTRDESPPGLTLCITVRNEKGNIEPLVRSLPILCARQEILFVEGHSTDGTREEIERVGALYPDKNVRVIGQPGIGQGDAIRVGFHAAAGEVIILYEGDGTSEPDDIRYFYAAIRSGRFEFIEGSRFVYPLSSLSMPILNQLGNMVFARWFSWVMSGHITDVLSGIKAIRKASYERLYPSWGFLDIEDPFGDFELIYGASRLGLKFGEIPIHYRPRPYGETKTRVFRHGSRLLRLVIRAYFVFRSMELPRERE